MSNIIQKNWADPNFYDKMTQDLIAGLQSGKIQLTGFHEDCNYERLLTLNFTDNSVLDSDDDTDS